MVSGYHSRSYVNAICSIDDIHSNKDTYMGSEIHTNRFSFHDYRLHHTKIKEVKWCYFSDILCYRLRYSCSDYLFWVYLYFCGVDRVSVWLTMREGEWIEVPLPFFFVITLGVMVLFPRLLCAAVGWIVNQAAVYPVYVWTIRLSMCTLLLVLVFFHRCDIYLSYFLPLISILAPLDIRKWPAWTFRYATQRDTFGYPPKPQVVEIPLPVEFVQQGENSVR